MHHTNLWNTKLFLSEWRFALYLHFPYWRFPPMRIRTYVRTCISILAKCAVSYLPFPYLRFPVLAFSAPPLRLVSCERRSQHSLLLLVSAAWSSPAAVHTNVAAVQAVNITHWTLQPQPLNPLLTRSTSHLADVFIFQLHDGRANMTLCYSAKS